MAKVTQRHLRVKLCYRVTFKRSMLMKVMKPSKKKSPELSPSRFSIFKRTRLGGTRIKTRKRNIAAPLDPAAFADAVVQIYLDNAGDLELVAKSIESSDLNFSRYGDTFFEVVFTGGRTQPGTTKSDEGERHTYSVIGCEPKREAILPSDLYLQKINFDLCFSSKKKHYSVTMVKVGERSLRVNLVTFKRRMFIKTSRLRILKKSLELPDSNVSKIKKIRSRKHTVGYTALWSVFSHRIPRLNFYMDELCWDLKPNKESAGVMVLEVEREQQSFKGMVLAGRLHIQLLVKFPSGLHAEVFEVVSGRAPARSRMLQCAIWEDFRFLSTASPWTLMLNISMHTLLCVNLLDGNCVRLEMPTELLGASTDSQLVGCLRGNPRAGSITIVLVACVENEKGEPVLLVASKRGGHRAAWTITQIADGIMRRRLEGASLIDGSVFWISNGKILECLDMKGRHRRSAIGSDFLEGAAKSLVPSHRGDHLLYIVEAGTGFVLVTNILDAELPFVRVYYAMSHVFAISGQEGVSLPLSFCRSPPLLFFAASGGHHLTQFSGGVMLSNFLCPFSTDGEHPACPCSATWFPHRLVS